MRSAGEVSAEMGSRASTLLRDEEIEEIKKETGCECGWAGGSSGRGGKEPAPRSQPGTGGCGGARRLP